MTEAGVAERGDYPELLSLVVIATGPPLAAGPVLLQVMWLVGIAAVALTGRQQLWPYPSAS